MQRRAQVAGDIEHAVVSLDAVAGRSSRTSGKASTWPRPQDLPDPALVASEVRQAARHVVGDPGPGGQLEAVVVDGPDRRRVRAQDALRLIHDHPQQLAPVVRGGQPPGDPEHRVEALGELRLEADRRRGAGRAGYGLRRRSCGPARRCGGRSIRTPWRPGRASSARSSATAAGDPAQPGGKSPRPGRTRTSPMVAPRHAPRSRHRSGARG